MIVRDDYREKLLVIASQDCVDDTITICNPEDKDCVAGIEIVEDGKQVSAWDINRGDALAMINALTVLVDE